MAGLIEQRSIDVVPDTERQGTAFSQFTLWLGANLQITAVVTGALVVVSAAARPGRSPALRWAICSAVP